MDVYNVRIKGISPILFHKYSPKPEATRVIRGSDAKHYEEEWKQSAYLDDSGKLVVPSTNIIACIFDGAKGLRKGKHYLTRLVYSSFRVTPFKPLIFVEDKEVTLKKVEKKGWIDVTGAKIKGNMVDRSRIMLNDWSIEFTLENTNDQLNSDDIRELVTNAGANAGLCEWRPSAPRKPGPYGRFVVEKFDKVK